MAEIDLLSSAHKGSERAFSALVHPLVDLGYRLACGMLHDAQAAEDAVQEASLTTWRKLDRVKDQGKFMSSGRRISNVSEHNPTPQAVFDRLPSSFQAEKAGNIKMTIQFNLSGENGGTWWARVAAGKCTVGEGAVASADLTLLADAADYVKMRLGQLDPMEAYETGKLKFKGKGSTSIAFRMLKLFKRSG
ncbi:MAG TPA: SCP2 sterol-binding domain-containing protein [Candidatus Dormibacteraeota bacterium]|nr:SCP2 sterol-binding domain-containing protein [Candidatus Dormibacteraeota bacterium]